MSAMAASDCTDGIADPKRRRWAIVSVLAGMVVVVLDAAVVNIALPTIASSLQIPPAAAVQIVTAYQLGLVMMLLPAAALGDSLGYRRVFVAGAVLFTAASVACALSTSLTWLVVARFMQGVGGAGIMALGIALLRFVVPAHHLGSAIGWNALTVALSSAAGPALGAAILAFGPWPWLFVANLPIGVCVLIAARALPREKGTGRPLNLPSAALSAGMFASFVLGAGCLQSRPATALTLLIGGALLAVVLVRRESSREDPLIPMDLLGRCSFRVCMAASILCFVGQTSALIALPFQLQHAFHMSPLTTALHLLPWPLAVAATSPWAGRLADRVGEAISCLIGASLLAVGLGSAAWASLHSQSLAIALCSLLCGVGFGLFNVSNNRSIFLSVPRERSAAAGSLQSTARLAGQTSGAIMMTWLFAAYPMRDAPRAGLAIAALLALAAGAISLLRCSTPQPIRINQVPG